MRSRQLESLEVESLCQSHPELPINKRTAFKLKHAESSTPIQQKETLVVVKPSYMPTPIQTIPQPSTMAPDISIPIFELKELVCNLASKNHDIIQRLNKPEHEKGSTTM